MKIILIILSVIGLLKLVSLFILCVIELYYKCTSQNFLEIGKDYGIYCKETDCHIIPTISFNKVGSYFEVKANFLKWEYYSAYKLKFDEDEK